MQQCVATQGGMMAGLLPWRCSYLADTAHVREELNRSTTLFHLWLQKRRLVYSPAFRAAVFDAKGEGISRSIAEFVTGVDVNARDVDTALMLAQVRGHNELVERLLKNGADVYAANYNRETALMHAAQNGWAVVKILLAHHADGNAGDLAIEPRQRLARIWQRGRNSCIAQRSQQGRKPAAGSR
jgi:Ankyrin repeats (3 copies)